MDVVASLPADSQATETVQPRDRPPHYPVEGTQARAVWPAAFGDHGTDAPLPEQPPVLAVVVAAVREQHVGPLPGPADDTSHGWDLVSQRPPGVDEPGARIEDVEQRFRGAGLDGLTYRGSAGRPGS